MICNNVPIGAPHCNLGTPLSSRAESLTESKEFMEFIVEEVLLRNEAVDKL